MTDPRGDVRLPNSDALPAEDTDRVVEANADPADSRTEAAAAPAFSERTIDLTLEQSFPASDPPGWTLGVEHGPGPQPAGDPREEES